MTALGVTEHGEVASHLRYQKMGDQYGVGIVKGIEGYLVDSISEVRENKERKNSHLCLFAETDEGLRNLWKLSTNAYLTGRYYRPLVDWDTLQGNVDGIIATDGCMLAYMARAILAEDDARIVDLIGRYVETFGENNFFMELHTWQFIDPQSPEDVQLNADMTRINQGKVKVAQTYGIPLIVVNDSHYANEDEWEHHALVWQINTHGDDDKTPRGKTASWIMTDDEVYFWMSKHGIARSVIEEAIENTARIAARCQTKIVGTNHLPTVTGAAATDTDLFWQTLGKGWQEKVVDKGLDQEVYLPRLQEELRLILDRGFDGYFNIVADYARWAKIDQGWLVGGRGSSNSSLVAYCMRITEVDPIKYNLMFARFISEGRQTLPDIDLDMPQSKRLELVRGYLPTKYGQMNVAGIGTLTRNGPKATLKDLCRVMNIPYADAQTMTKIIAQVTDIEDDEEFPLSWDEVLASRGGDLQPWARKYPEMFAKLEDMIGLIRQSSSHASGILIANNSLLGEMPLRIKGDNPQPVTQFENSESLGDAEVQEMGYEKFDILGLRHLDTLMVFRDMVRQRHGVLLDFSEWTDEQYADPAIWAEPNRGDTLGIFQVETAGGSKVAARFNIANQWDMSDLVAANRPGVIKAGMLDELIERRAGTRQIKSIHSLVDDILSQTHGIILYQEQVLRIVQAVARYTSEEADKVRKMMGKKKMDLMILEKPKFIQACCDNPEFVRLLQPGQQAKQVAQKIWNNIEPSAGYSFAQAHAVPYGMIGCWEAWGRHYYPQEFMTSLMITDPGKVPAYVGWAKKRGIAILPPDINDSDKGFKLTDEGIRYGLTSVMSVGDRSFGEIVEKRPFTSFQDLLERTSLGGFNARVGENLISIGALDRWGTRESLMAHFYTVRKIKNKQIPDFYDDVVVGQIEKKLVGSYITRNPAERFAADIEQKCLPNPEALEDLLPAEIANVGGLVTTIKLHKTKKGDPMCWMTIDWRGEQFELVVFPEAYRGYKMFLAEETPVICQVERLDNGAMVRRLTRLDRQ